MKTTLTVLTSILLAFALNGTAIATLPEIELPEEAVPTGGLAGQAIGCNLENDSGFVYGHGKSGVPTSNGEDGECEWAGEYEHSGDVTHTVFKLSGTSGFTSAYGVDASTGEYAVHTISCDDAASLLVDWTMAPPRTTYLEGGDCSISVTGTLNLGDVEWSAYGAGRDGDVKFVYTDNLADALVHLLG